MSTCACVLSKNGERLMPTIRLGKVRHLLKDGKAEKAGNAEKYVGQPSWLDAH